jgi:sporulation protein YlmC with PRC-barrel domain
MKLGELMGRHVIDSQARYLGKVCEIELDIGTWKITDICVDLEKAVAEPMGFSKPRIGSIKVRVPVEDVNAIRDVVSLKKSAVELKGVARKI